MKRIHQNHSVELFLNNLGLNEALDRSCNVLSGGERTKLSLAVLFSTKANMLILDEPTNF